MATLKEAIEYSRKNPQSDFAIQLKQRIQSGKADQDAAQEGIDLSWAGRPKAAPPQSVAPVPTQTKGTLLTPLKEGVSGLKTLYGGGEQGIATKLKTSIQEGAEGYREGVEEGGVKGMAKATGALLTTGFRTAGDVAGTVYAPVGAALGATGIGKVFDWIGEMSQKGGKYNPINAITDMKSVQQFVAESPNLEEDFTRALNLAFAGMEKGKIDPKTVVSRTINQFKSMGPKGTPTVNAGGKEWTLDELHNSSDFAKMRKSLTPVEQQTVSAFDQKYSQTQRQQTDVPKVPGRISSVVKQGKEISRDIIPTKERFVNTEVTKALDLTQGDVKNISLSTGNEVGQFLANKNLIGNSVDDTVTNIKRFQKENYDSVRAEIAKVKNTYLAEKVPRYKEALSQIQSQIDDVAGLQGANAEVKALLKKENPTLQDIQRVKELMDEHFELYKATGDVKQGVAKEGLAIIRREIKEFIEAEVKKTTRADIREMNNNVQTARSIDDAIETRSTRGLTRSMITTPDVVTYLIGSGGGAMSPLTGLAAVLVKKLWESPSFKLRFSRWLDSRNDAQKAKILEDLKGGNDPEGVKLNQRSSSKSLSSKSNNDNGQSNITSNDFIINLS